MGGLRKSQKRHEQGERFFVCHFRQMPKEAEDIKMLSPDESGPERLFHVRERQDDSKKRQETESGG